MELNLILEIIVIIFIMIEIYSLAHHAKLEHEVINHIKKLDEQIVILNKHLESNYLEPTNKEQEM